MCGRISLAPKAQFKPMESKSPWRIEFKNASTVCPDKVRPDASVMVPEIIISPLNLIAGFKVSCPNSCSYLLIAKIAALAFNVSNMVSISKTSEPPSTKPRTCS